MDDFEIKIDDHKEFGEILKRWSKFPNDKPKTVREFRLKVPDAIVKLGVGFKDADILAIFDAPSKKTVSIVIPHPDDLDDPVPEPYPLPDFYERVFGTEPEIDDGEVFRCERIADYAMKKCV